MFAVGYFATMILPFYPVRIVACLPNARLGRANRTTEKRLRALAIYHRLLNCYDNV